MNFAIETAQDIDKLEVDGAVDRLDYVAKTLSLLRKSLGKEKALLGFCGSPWTLACYAIDGGSSTGFPRTLAFAQEQPDALQRRSGQNLQKYHQKSTQRQKVLEFQDNQLERPRAIPICLRKRRKKCVSFFYVVGKLLPCCFVPLVTPVATFLNCIFCHGQGREGYDGAYGCYGAIEGSVGKIGRGCCDNGIRSR